MTAITLTTASACLLILCVFQIITITHALRYSRHHGGTTHHHAGVFVNAEPPPRQNDNVNDAADTTDWSQVDEWSITPYKDSFRLKTLNMTDTIRAQIEYLVGNDRDIRISVLKSDCQTELDNPSSIVTTNYTTTHMGVNKISNLTVSLDFNRVAIESSPLWKNVSVFISTVELCLMVELHTEAFEDSLATSSLPVSFQVPRIPSEPTDDSSSPIETTIDLSIVSCLCDDDLDDECLPLPATIMQNDAFRICVRTNASTAAIRHVDYLMLTHDGIPKGFPITTRNGPDIFTKIETRSDGKIVISSPIPVQVYKDQEEGEGDGVVTALGAVIVEWDPVGRRRDLKERVVQDTAGFNDIIDWRANRGVGEVKEFKLDMELGPYVPENNDGDDDEYTRSGIPLLRLLNCRTVMIGVFGFVAANK